LAIRWIFVLILVSLGTAGLPERSARIIQSLVSGENQGPVQNAARGDIATGRLIREESGELDLDTSPCNGDRVVRFHEPYEKTIIGQLRCSNQALDKIQVHQK
jgi:hypothetical protein